MRKTYFFLLVFVCSFGLLNAQNNFNADDVLSDFECLILEPDSYWNGADLSGGFTSGLAYFPNVFDTTWMAWNHWAYSNMADDTTAGWLNQFSAITAQGYDPISSGGVNYGLAFVPSDLMTANIIPIAMNFSDMKAHLVKGLYVTNTTYAALSMEHGDQVSKKFGGETGDDPDYFKLLVWGMINGSSTDIKEFFLADYCFENNDEDYIVKSWEWIDLESLGEVDSLMFSMESTDVGLYGINTPTYFCIDNVTIVPDDTGIFGHSTPGIELNVYPNPTYGMLRVETAGYAETCIYIMDLNGTFVYVNETYQSGQPVDLEGFAAGCYILKVRYGQSVSVAKIILR